MSLFNLQLLIKLSLIFCSQKKSKSIYFAAFKKIQINKEKDQLKKSVSKQELNLTDQNMNECIIKKKENIKK